MEVTAQDSHAVFRQGQELYACSRDHLSKLLSDPVEYIRPHEKSHTQEEVVCILNRLKFLIKSCAVYLQMLVSSFEFPVLGRETVPSLWNAS